MDHRRIGTAPDYTNAALTMIGVNLIWMLTLIWALWGFLVALSLTALINHAITRLARRRMA